MPLPIEEARHQLRISVGVLLNSKLSTTEQLEAVNKVLEQLYELPDELNYLAKMVLTENKFGFEKFRGAFTNSDKHLGLITGNRLNTSMLSSVSAAVDYITRHSNDEIGVAFYNILPPSLQLSVYQAINNPESHASQARSSSPEQLTELTIDEKAEQVLDQIVAYIEKEAPPPNTLTFFGDKKVHLGGETITLTKDNPGTSKSIPTTAAKAHEIALDKKQPPIKRLQEIEDLVGGLRVKARHDAATQKFYTTFQKKISEYKQNASLEDESTHKKGPGSP